MSIKAQTWRVLAFLFMGMLALPVAWAAAATGSAQPKADRTDFWSFRPIASPAIPQVRDRAWIRNPIDCFILSRLESEKLHPAPKCDRRTLIRRVTFDLTGLPPTPEEIDRFVADRAPDAYEKLVDRLLASPRYGERWARHWLDVVRFADSNGFEMNQPREHAWPYRDYVIRSFNNDKPYDQFVREQLAGDATGVDEATGYLVAGPWDQVKSPDPNLTAQQRVNELHDMVSTTGATFVGLTVGCARCHDHKFDPITQQDYYGMQAIFAGVQHGDRLIRSKAEEEHERRLIAARLAVDAELSAFAPKATLDPHPDADAERYAVQPTRNVDRFDPAEAKFVRLTISATTGSEPCIDELEVFAAGDTTHDVALASAGAKATASSLLPGFPIHQIEHLNDGLYGNDHSWVSNEPGKGWVQIELPRAMVIDRVVWGRDRDQKFTDRVATSYTIEVAVKPGRWRVVASSADRAAYPPPAGSRPVYETQSATDAQAMRKLLAQDQALAAEARKLASGRMVYAGTFMQPPPTHRLYRGEAMQPREIVAPSAVAFIGPKLELATDTPEQQRRLALADWITNPQNPLAARVIVNRLWQYHFGRGIVDTPSDFGHMGARPTHPQLLDWMATQLVKNHWQLKSIQRMIVLSATYRQSSQFDPEADKIDSASALLWRFPPQRLEAEEIRDSILSISGKLDLTMGGPGFDVFKPNNNYVRVYAPKDEFGPAEWRRMIYQFKPRLQYDGVFGAFDCPDGSQITPKRSSSTTPLQALNLLNSRFMIDQANFFAQRVKKEAGADPSAQVQRAFKLAFGRLPSDAEQRSSEQVIRTRGLPLLCRALLNANEFVYVF